MNFRRLFIPVVCFVIALLFAATALRSIAHRSKIERHRQRFAELNDYAKNELWAISTPEKDKIDAPFQKLFAELDRLVDLGAITRLEVACDHVLDDTPERNLVFTALVSEECPPCLYWRPNNDDGSRFFTLVVWCEHDHEAEWRAYMSQLDDVIRDSEEKVKGV